ncbi:MAG: hypothetical protein HOH70_15620 [Halieaceae bacterium]|nr:hypothetical protein [Halieaceae bacterium]MBT6126619.1 hypothetical protein [Halieaceae bacterium]
MSGITDSLSVKAKPYSDGGADTTPHASAVHIESYECKPVAALGAHHVFYQDLMEMNKDMNCMAVQERLRFGSE